MASQGAPKPSAVDYINHLANELLLDIIDYITADDKDNKLRNLAALSKVSRRFHSLITPMLYARLPRCCCLYQFELFEAAISSNPTLAGYVKSVEETPLENMRFYRKHFPLFKDKDHATVTNTRTAMRMAKAAQLQIPEHVLGAVSATYTPELEYLFILCKCPNIEEIDLSGGWNFLMYTPLTYAANSMPLGLVHDFKHLHSLSITVKPCREYPFHHLYIVFMLRSLRTLELRYAAMDSDEEKAWKEGRYKWDFEPRTSPIQNLILHGFGVDSQWVKHAVSHCAALKQFSCIFEKRHLGDLGGGSLYADISSALSEHRNTLEDVQVNELNGCRHAQRILPYSSVSWKDFPRLEYLDISLYTLALPAIFTGMTHKTSPVVIEEVLPPSLRVLSIDISAQREGRSDQFFIALAEASSRYFPRLKRLEVFCRLEDRILTGLFPLHFCHLQRMFAAQGIEFTYFIHFTVCAFAAHDYKSLVKKLKRSGPDGREIARQCSFEVGCHLMYQPPFDGRRSDLNDQTIYMESWKGAPEFEWKAPGI